jgi:hypothetical protein
LIDAEDVAVSPVLDAQPSTPLTPRAAVETVSKSLKTQDPALASAARNNIAIAATQDAGRTVRMTFNGEYGTLMGMASRIAT